MGELGIGSKAAHVIDNFYSCSQASFGNLGFLRIERNRNSQFALQTLEHRQDTRDLLAGADRMGSGTRGFAAYIEDVRASLLHLEGPPYGGLRAGITASGIKTIGRDVEDSHD
jgi:hypothetical protein